MTNILRKINVLLLIAALVFVSLPLASYAVDNYNATIYITADDAYNLYVNGAYIGTNNDWRQKESFRVKLEGDYLIAVEAWDEHQVIAGFNLQVLFDGDSTPTVVTGNGQGWVQSTEFTQDWESPLTTITGWNDVTNVSDSRWTNIDGQWVWTDKYVYKTSPGAFDNKVYFRFVGYRTPQPNLMIASTIYEATTDASTSTTTYSNNDLAGYVVFSWGSTNIQMTTGSQMVYMPSGTTLTVTPYANTGFEFVDWKQNLDTPNPPISNGPYVTTIGENTSSVEMMPVFRKVAETPTDSTNETEIPSETETPTQPVTEAPTVPIGPQGTVTVSYVDTEGNSLGSAFSFTGTVGTLYQTSSRTFEGYTLVEVPSNASGTFADGSITVDYVYSNGETIVEEDTPLGEAITPFNFDSIYDNVEMTTESVEEDILDETTPLGDTLPQTGQASPELFYGVGSLITVAGLYLKRKSSN